MTDQELDGSVSMTLSEYRYTDYLLCHDDRMPYRRIAYVLYLSELFFRCLRTQLTFSAPDEWTDEDGGALRLFDTDGVFLLRFFRLKSASHCSNR